MRIKKISLNNIRSYDNGTLEFPDGSILLSGGIGTGKTSILLGIEFALFGLQPGQRGHSLLKNGEKSGGVTIDFEIDGKEITIERTLKRSKTVNQDYCSIIINGDKKEISVSELKDIVLGILGYPREFAKKQNLLYKFTVYTPQEEMKQIILQDAQTRLNTLRHVFGIEKYKRIIENVQIVLSKIREERRINEGKVLHLDEDKRNLFEKENALEEKRKELLILEEEVASKRKKRILLEQEKNEVSKKIEERNKFQRELDKSKIMFANKKESIINNEKIREDLKNQLENLSKISFKESLIENLLEDIALIKKEKEKFSSELLIISSKISSLNIKNEENLQLEKKMANLDICPTCLQNVDAVYRANVINKTRNETVKNNKEISELEENKISISKKIKEIEDRLFLKEKSLRELEVIKLRLSEINDKKIRLTEIESKIDSLRKDSKLLESQMKKLHEEIFNLNKFENIFSLKQKELEEARRVERISEIKFAEIKKEIEFLQYSIDELKKRILVIESIKNKINYLGELESWITQKFMPLVATIEKNVMIKLNSDFSKLFEEWFSILVPEQFNVHLDDAFTPVIEQQDYEIDYSYLSGGERTAIALAYRLALNQVINSLMSKIKTKDIVILDEPTDGFSEQQLDKMRDVLQQLSVKQLIIVSHEQKIEGFVEHVIKLQKENGVSKINL